MGSALFWTEGAFYRIFNKIYKKKKFQSPFRLHSVLQKLVVSSQPTMASDSKEHVREQHSGFKLLLREGRLTGSGKVKHESGGNLSTGKLNSPRPAYCSQKEQETKSKSIGCKDKVRAERGSLEEEKTIALKTGAVKKCITKITRTQHL